MPYLRGWNFTFSWKNIEPRKGKFNWKEFDQQFDIAIKNGLFAGFMVYVGNASLDWIYKEDGVPKVFFNDSKHPELKMFPYYMHPAYKQDYHNMLKAVAGHIASYPQEKREKVVFWMSAEGSTGDETPYKYDPLDPQYEIPMDDWFEFKKEAWKLMYDLGNSMNPKLNILINQSNDGKYFDYLTKNLPNVWFKAGAIAHTYQFVDEQEYVERFYPVVNADNNGMNNRIRSESEEVQKLGWFRQSPVQNNFALIASCLHFGLDILNIRKELPQMVKSEFPFIFFNKYAGQRDPKTASGAFCVMRDVLDILDTTIFPTSRYGAIYEKNAEKPKDNQERDYLKGRLYRNISEARRKRILDEFMKYGAQGGPSPEVEKQIYSDDAALEPKLQRKNLRIHFIDKFNVDIGANLIPGNYTRFLTQVDAGNTSRGGWRIGPKDQPFGRYARRFDHEAGMDEMFFSLDKNFFSSNQPTKAKVSVTYFDGANGKWALNYFDGHTKQKAYEVQCKNSNRWITKSIELNGCFCNGLNNNSDLSIEYLSGDDTYFSLIELER